MAFGLGSCIYGGEKFSREDHFFQRLMRLRKVESSSLLEKAFE